MVPSLTDNEALGIAIRDLVQQNEGARLPDEEVARLVASANVEHIHRDANAINSAFVFERNGVENHLQVEVVWDAERAAWFSFFDGEGPDMAFVEQAEDGTYVIDWGE